MYNDGYAFGICGNEKGKESPCSGLWVWLIVCFELSANATCSGASGTEWIWQRKKSGTVLAVPLLYYKVGTSAPGMGQNQI